MKIFKRVFIFALVLANMFALTVWGEEGLHLNRHDMCETQGNSCYHVPPPK